jgi:hypothetical protein
VVDAVADSRRRCDVLVEEAPPREDDTFKFGVNVYFGTR